MNDKIKKKVSKKDDLKLKLRLLEYQNYILAKHKQFAISENQLLIQCLAYYADSSIYGDNKADIYGHGIAWGDSEISKDKGNKARKLLEKLDYK